MKGAIALFPRNTSLDAIGPYETLQRVPSIDVVFVGHRRGGAAFRLGPPRQGLRGDARAGARVL